MTGLLGLPLLLIFSIFASGVYCGVTRADRVVELEQRLGIEPPPGRLMGTTGDHQPDNQAEGQPDNQDEDNANAADTGDGATSGTPAVAETDSDHPQPDQPAKLPPTTNEPTNPDANPPGLPIDNAPGLASAHADPVGPELRQRFEEARVVHVLIMVDPALVVTRADWLSYIANLFEATKSSYAELFGIDLQLHGVVVWDAAVGADNDELERDLASRSLNGADVLLGLVARERPAKYTPTGWADAVTGDHALVFADLEQTDRYYRNMLRSLALLFGAEPALDSGAKQLGSFMSDVPLAASGPALDPENRGRVIISKRRPFVQRSPEVGAHEGADADSHEPGQPESEGH